MAVEFRHDIYFSWRPINGYNKAFNFVMSPREPGKTTSAWYEMIYTPFKKDHRPWIYFVRQTVEITEALINSIFDTVIHKFTDDNVKPIFKLGSFKDGIVDVNIHFEDTDETFLFFRIVSLSIALRRIKLAVLKNIKGVFMDEYIIDPRTDEKYQNNEAFKIKEAYTTWRRECDGILKFYFSANPYSLFNPLFIDWNVDVKKLHKGQFYVGDTFVIQWATLHPELRKLLLEKNPLYQFDEDYNQYALEGTAINDKNIKLGTLPIDYHLQFTFRYQNKYIGVFKNDYLVDRCDYYFVKFLDVVSAKRTSYCIDFESMMERTQLISIDERSKLSHFKSSIRRNLVSFEDINVYYMCIEIYKNI